MKRLVALMFSLVIAASCGSNGEGAALTNGVLGGDGRYSDLPQGTYWSPDMPDTGCFWVLLKDDPTDPPGVAEYNEEDVLQQGNSNGLEVQSDGWGFITEGCGVWEQR